MGSPRDLQQTTFFLYFQGHELKHENKNSITLMKNITTIFHILIIYDPISIISFPNEKIEISVKKLLSTFFQTLCLQQ